MSRLSGRRVGAPPATRGGKDYRPLIGPWSGWGHHGDVRDALDYAISPFTGAGDGPLLPALTTRKLALFGLALRTSTAKPTICTLRWALVLYGRKPPVLTASDVQHPATAACRALIGYATTAPRCSSMGPIFGTKLTTACCDWGKISARTTTDGELWCVSWTTPGTDQASALSGLATRLRQVRGSRLLVSSNPSR